MQKWVSHGVWIQKHVHEWGCSQWNSLWPSSTIHPSWGSAILCWWAKDVPRRGLDPRAGVVNYNRPSPHLELDRQNKRWDWLRWSEAAKSILQRLFRDFQAHLRKPCFLLDSLKTSRQQLRLWLAALNLESHKLSHADRFQFQGWVCQQGLESISTRLPASPADKLAGNNTVKPVVFFFQLISCSPPSLLS